MPQSTVKSFIYMGIPLIFISGIFFILNPSAAQALNESYVVDAGGFGIWAFLILAVVIAPPLEETVFRLWLEPRFAWSVTLPLAFATVLFDAPWVPVVFIPLIVGAGVMFRKRLGKAIVAHRAVFVWISAIGFSVFHLMNFSSPSWVHIVLLSGFTGLGLCFAALRISKGMRYAILAHATYNLFLWLFMLPPLQSQVACFGAECKGVLVTRGIIHGHADTRVGEKKLLCGDCNATGVVYSLFRAYDPDAVTTVDAHFHNPFLRYDLAIENASLPTFNFDTFRELLTETFGFQVEENMEVLPVYRLDFYQREGHDPTPENVVKLSKSKGQSERVVTLGGGLATVLQRNYAVRVICRSGCDLPLVFVYDEALGVEENLGKFRAEGLLDFTREEESVRVIRVMEN